MGIGEPVSEWTNGWYPAGPSSLDLDSLHRRRARIERRKRAGALTVSLAIVVALVGGMFSLARDSRERTNAGGGGSGVGVGSGSTISGPTVDLSLASGQYYYVRINGEFASWWAMDDSGQMNDLGYGQSGTFASGGFVSDSGPVAYLSTDPTELEAQLRARVQPDGASPEPYQDWGYSPAPAQEGPITWGLVRSIGELLDAPDVSPAQKAALFQVAAGLGGMDVTQAVTDPAGRPAIRLSIETESALHEWWFDPASEQLLAMRETPTTGAAGAPTIVEVAGVTRTLGSTDLRRCHDRSARLRAERFRPRWRRRRSRSRPRRVSSPEAANPGLRRECFHPARSAQRLARTLRSRAPGSGPAGARPRSGWRCRQLRRPAGAHHRGAHVIGTASTPNVEAVSELGADRVIDHTTTRWNEVVEQVDLVFDTVGGDRLERSPAVVRPGGRLVSVAEEPSQEAALARGIDALYFVVGPNRDQLIEITTLVEGSDLRATIDAVFQLADASKAFERSLGDHGAGKTFFAWSTSRRLVGFGASSSSAIQ